MTKLILREVTAEDVYQLFNWTNDKTVRENSFSVESIKWQDHLDWFNNKLNSDRSKIFILTQENDSIGQIRFDLIEDESWLINYSIDKNFRGSGYGSKIVEMAIKSFSNSTKLTAKVKKSNLASARVFQKLGFNQIVTINGDYVFQLNPDI